MNRAPSSLENLKKRAKSLQKQHAARYFPVASRIRNALPDWAERTDREILDAPFSLARAQEVVAREHSFESWAQLKRSHEKMASADRSESEEAATPLFLAVHPQVFVTDMERALDFYRDRLGFVVGYVYGDPPDYALVSRDGIGINLRHVDEMPFDPAARARDDLLSATLIVQSLKALFLAYKESGIEFHQPYREQPWGAVDFIVEDPDRNLLHFASPVDD